MWDTAVALCSIGIATVILSIFLLHLLRSAFRPPPAPARANPCPQSYPIIGNLIGFLRNRHRFHDWVADMLSQTPSATLQVKSFLNLSSGVCTADPLNVQHLLITNFSNYVKGSRYHGVLHELLGEGIFAVDGHLWATQRKIASYEFSNNSLKHFISDTVNSEISNRLIPFLSDASGRVIIDLQEVLQKFTFDNVCKVVFGVDPQSLTLAKKNSSKNSIFLRAFDDATEIVFSRFMSPLPALWKIKRFLNIGSEKRFSEAIESINEFAMNIIRSKETEDASSNLNLDLLSRFMLSSNLEFGDSQQQRRKFLRDIVISFMLAGKDSTSTALTWFFWVISGHPRCQHRILEELSSWNPRGRMLSYEELKQLHYIHAAITESLRLFPPVPINSRLTLDDDVLPDGTRVGRGWFADYSAYAMGRSEKVWGEDCREFKPERWLDDNGRFQQADQFRFPVFHCGPRMCLGKEMAYVQMKSIVAAVMAEFEVMLVDGGAVPEKMVQPPYVLSLLLKMKGGLPVRLTRRSSL